MILLDIPSDGPVYQTDATCKDSVYRGWFRSTLLRGLSLAAVFLSASPSFLSAAESSGHCRELKTPERRKPALVRHLDKDCTSEERETRSVQADDILRTLQKGRDVDLAGVIVKGDVRLEALPVKTPKEILPALSPDDRQTVGSLGAPAIRYISGTLSIRDSEVRGRILNQMKDERLVISGPVIFSGTRFQEAVDLSRTVFLGVVDCSSASFARESYFVEARFQQPVLFTQTVFGPHTRFHRSVFHGAANFYHARFNGLAELLEVSFEKGAGFFGAQFTSGTGFSGSRFGGIADFVETQFQGDVYFLFTRFEHEARFRGTAFGGVADFSDVLFAAGQDLAQAGFVKPPQLPQSLRGEMPMPATAPSWMAAQYGVTLAFLAMALLLLGYLLKIK
jgi:uncharacterized protein YjbI with pentapeptide repeats